MIAGAAPIAASATTQSPARASGQRVTPAHSASWWFASRSTANRFHPHAKPILLSPIAQTVVKAVFRLIQRIFIAEAALWLTALICALAGLPAVVTAFSVALVGFIGNLWLAGRTLAPLCRKLLNGGQA